MSHYHQDFTPQHRAIGRAAAWATCAVGVVYTITTALGFLSLKSPQDPFEDPYLTIMEVLIILISPLMVVSLAAVHAYARPEVKLYSQMALIFMIVMAGISSSVHFVILAVSRQIATTQLPLVPFLLSWNWPSVPYALDILAWDWFFALSTLCAALVFKGGRLEKVVRILLLITGGVSLAGLIGVPLSNMQIRDIGIIGYGGVSPFAFLLIGIVLSRTHPEPQSTHSNHDVQVAPARS